MPRRSAADIEAEHVDVLSKLTPAQRRAIEREIDAAVSCMMLDANMQREARRRRLSNVFQAEADGLWHWPGFAFLPEQFEDDSTVSISGAGAAAIDAS